MKPILAVDFNGALMRSRPFDKAHIDWFRTMAVLLHEEKINEYASLEGDYFPKVHEVMEKYLGDVDHETRVRFARNLYAMATIAEARKNDVVDEFAEFLLKKKNAYRLALITSAPEAAVEPILKKVGCGDLFDIVYKSPMHRHPDKKELFKEFIGEHGEPAFYIGNGDKDITSCRSLGIPTISVNWVSRGNVKGDHDIDNVDELDKII